MDMQTQKGTESMDNTGRCVPAAFAYVVRGRSPGSEVLRHRLPGKIPVACDDAALPYRCGGSAGIKLGGSLAGFPYLHRLPVSLDNLMAVEHRGHALCFLPQSAGRLYLGARLPVWAILLKFALTA